MIVFILVVAAVAALGVVILIPRLQVRTLPMGRERLTLENELRKTAAQVVGGVVVLVGVYSAVETLRLGTQTQITERFAKAVEQLGQKERLVRVGAVYSLGRLSQDSERDHWTIVQVLDHFVSERAGIKRKSGESGRSDECYLEKPEELFPCEDVYAALLVLGTRRREHDPKGSQLRLSWVDLRGISMVDQDWSDTTLMFNRLSGAFIKNVNMSRARLMKTSFGRAYLGEVDFTEAELWGVDFRGATLVNVNFSGASFGKWVVRTPAAGFVWSDASFPGASFYPARLEGVDLSKVSGLQAKHLSQACISHDTVLPTDLRSIEYQVPKQCLSLKSER